MYVGHTTLLVGDICRSFWGAIFAKVGNQVYMYEIAGIYKDGYLDKKISVFKAKSY